MNTQAVSQNHDTITTRTAVETTTTTVNDAWAQLQFSSLLQAPAVPAWNPNRSDDEEEENA